ncbi:Hydroxysteroid dehydrogenase-like protein 2 [Acropora cervicornis]|uniref:Hydroxysteroid dehydrogenase-like protein 2 n=1 Tax=Acropora cervicornis TaxID=6130 RepID=A0AAD9VDC4_ACRCE|nr:Hydroxysteroid dehydrogenase-like protein 2 [Acropora cervicornis]
MVIVLRKRDPFLATSKAGLFAKDQSSPFPKFPKKLAGKTLFITGASRGIGKAIALKAARDGANIVIAAKTAKPHPKLPGTIYTAAKEVEDAGGKCLPCAVDIQDEEAVYNAVGEAVKKFGGIDIVVNNASVINLTGTLETTMKKYDLMSRVNVRGTSKACLPYLKDATNPHILNITVPLNMRHEWFKDNIAIATVAVEVLYDKDTLKYCRKDSIIADAAYVMLTRDSKTRTGEYLYDEEVLMEEGITDFNQYLVSPESPIAGVAEVFEALKSCCNKEVVQMVNAVFEFQLTGKEPGVWYLDLKDNEGSVGSGKYPGGEVGCTMIMDSEDFVRMFQGHLNPLQLSMLDRLEIKGHKVLALHIPRLMGKLAGRTIFITGASRGIGKAIALKAARDGANIVIAAKTTEPHPKLPGTIYTAAKEVEEAGGKCLPCVVDIRDERTVDEAVKEAVKKFGGIDILV